MIILSVVLALLAALGNAGASVLQRRAAAVDLPGLRGSHLFGKLGFIRRPAWRWGAGLLVVSGLAQALALATGPLAVVQPVMTTELLFTLVLAAVVFRRPPGVRTWGAFLGMALGLAVFLLLASPTGGLETVPPKRWLFSAVPAATVSIVLIVVGMRLRGSARAAVLGSATAIGFAFTAALIKDTLGLVSGGVEGLFATWQIYTAAAVGLSSFLLLQATLRAGSLAASQPALTLGDSLLSVILGVSLFEEQIDLGWRVLPEAAALALIVLASVHLSSSPVVSGKDEQRW
ncbi:DMT family transporter [Streptomyces sp. NBC_00154]|uniref:DMT family transporter n=1 Tax=Streptomyces sp. NBC_00154 TaxID=2975670 RepID=UPI00225A5236|nr:DMT family transporter [Streptomyces sp. NBC_00154]MCX5316587.1 DMT family transporter [Streptomyces sp. NBC_00154]